MGRLIQHTILFILIRRYKGLGNFFTDLLPQA